MPNMSPKQMAQEIARSPETQQFLLGKAHEIAEDATRAADSLVGDLKAWRGDLQHKDAPYFGTDVTVGSDAARAHVWAANGAAIHAERKGAVLVAASADVGIKRKTERDKPTGKMSGRSGGGK